MVHETFALLLRFTCDSSSKWWIPNFMLGNMAWNGSIKRGPKRLILSHGDAPPSKGRKMWQLKIWVFPKIGGKPPKWMVKIMEIPMSKWMIWGEFSHYFRSAIHLGWAISTKNVVVTRKHPMNKTSDSPSACFRIQGSLRSPDRTSRMYTPEN